VSRAAAPWTEVPELLAQLHEGHSALVHPVSAEQARRARVVLASAELAPQAPAVRVPAAQRADRHQGACDSRMRLRTPLARILASETHAAGTPLKPAAAQPSFRI
jgi:hypothetical protein